MTKKQNTKTELTQDAELENSLPYDYEEWLSPIRKLFIERARNPKKNSRGRPAAQRDKIPVSTARAALKMALTESYWNGYRAACSTGGQPPSRTHITMIESATEMAVDQILNAIHREMVQKPGIKPFDNPSPEAKRKRKQRGQPVD